MSPAVVRPRPVGYTGSVASSGPEDMTNETILDRCEALGLRMTGQRRTIALVLSESEDHPDVEELHRRSAERDSNISIATVYRTVKLFEESGLLERHDFREGRARYEDADRDHHDHLIDVVSGEIIEFFDDEIEALQRRVAEKLGYALVDHRLELYGRPLPQKKSRES